MNYTLAKMMEEAQILNFPDWFNSINIVDPDGIQEDFKPRWHQITGLNLGMIYDRAGLYDDQGTGKALISQAWAIWNAGVGNKCVCLMPPILVGQYTYNLIHTFIRIQDKLKIASYGGTKGRRQKLINAWDKEGYPDIVVMSYQMFMKEWALFQGYSAAVLDEACLANENSKTSEAINSFMGSPGDKNALVLNGTPAGNDLTALFGFIQFVTPGVYRSRLHFNTLHVDFKDIQIRVNKGGELSTREVKVVDKFRNLDLLYSNLYKQARRVMKSQVLELKEKNIIPFSFDLSEKHEEMYLKACTEMLLEFDDGSILDMTTSAKLRSNAMRSIMHPSILGVNEDSAVLDALDCILESALKKSKALVFCHYRDTVELLAEHLKKLNPAVIYGGSNTEKNKEKFLKDPTCQVAVVNWTAGGIGLNFQSVCSEVIAAEPTTVPGQFDQATDRAHRSGQKDVVNVYVLMPRKTLYVKAVANMTKKGKSNYSVINRAAFLAELRGEAEAEQQAAPEQEKAQEVLATGWQPV